LGLGPLAYFFGRPQEGTLNVSCSSFAVVAIAVAEAVFANPRRFGPVGPALATVTAAAFVFAIADGFEHFMRPLDPSRGNSTFLRRCLAEEGCHIAELPRNIWLALHTQPLDPRTKVGYYVREAGPRIEEAISMLRRLSPNAHYVGMLTEDQNAWYGDANAAAGMTALMATGQWYSWSISDPVIDGDSSIITGQILKRVEATPSGMPIVISKQTDRWASLNHDILATLRAHCRLALLEEGKYQSVFVTENCSQ